jgi:hypothetical protein
MAPTVGRRADYDWRSYPARVYLTYTLFLAVYGDNIPSRPFTVTLKIGNEANETDIK